VCSRRCKKVEECEGLVPPQNNQLVCRPACDTTPQGTATPAPAKLVVPPMCYWIGKP
jgi:hypothetical protein